MHATGPPDRPVLAAATTVPWRTGPPRPPALEVVRSAARRRTSSAAVRRGRIVVRVPAGLPTGEEQRVVDDLLVRLRARAATPPPPSTLPASVPSRATRGVIGGRGAPALVARADAVAARWLPELGPAPAARVVWSHRMTTRWASVTNPPGHIRVSHRLADAPDEVLDDVLLHEQAHLLEHGHGATFRRLVARNPRHADVERWLAGRTHAELIAALGLA